jgi:hypothetical protein
VQKYASLAIGLLIIGVGVYVAMRGLKQVQAA